jgi:hypothetical protein
MYRTADRWFIDTATTTDASKFMRIAAYPATIAGQDSHATNQTDFGTMEWTRA